MPWTVVLPESWFDQWLRNAKETTPPYDDEAAAGN